VNKLLNVDRRIIYVILVIALAFPLIRPLGIPLLVNDSTTAVHAIIEGLDPATDVVLLSFDYGPSSAGDIHPQATAIVNHLTKRGIKWVGVAFWADGPMMADLLIADLEAQGGKYGTDFVNLGFMTGGENAIRSFAVDALVIPTDIRGNKTADLPVMQGIKDMNDFGFVFEFASGTPGYEAFIRQAVDPMGVKFAAGVVTVSVTGAMPFYNSGQLKGLLQGLRGAAEYELLIGIPGDGAAAMDASSLGHLVIVGFILVGNFAYFFSKKKK